MTPSTRHELKALTIARFFAALIVVMVHEHSWPSWVQGLIGGGSVAVIFFFMLSGFVLAYGGEFVDGSGDRLGFYVRRFARIYPVYMLAWMLYGVVLVLSWLADPNIDAFYMVKAGVTFGSLSATLVQAWVPAASWAWNLPGWSLSVEAFFYALFPIIFLLLAKRSNRTIVLVLIVAFTLNLFCRAIMSNDTPLLTGTPFSTTWGRYLEFFPPLHLCQFIFGVGLGLLYVRFGHIKGPALWIVLTLSMSMSGALMSLHSQPGSLWNAWILAPFAALIYALASLRPQGRLTEIGTLLGKASYAIYIFQTPVKSFFGATDEMGGFLTFFLFLIALAVVVHQYFERPLERIIKAKYIASRSARIEAVGARI